MDLGKPFALRRTADVYAEEVDQVLKFIHNWLEFVNIPEMESWLPKQAEIVT
jgi:hypothetical protein